MTPKKAAAALSIIFVLAFSASFDRFKGPDRDKRQGWRMMETIRALHDGGPYRLGESRYAIDRVLVRFRPSLEESRIQATINAYAAKKVKRIPNLDIYVLQIPEGQSVEDMLAALEQNPDVESSSPDYITYLAAVPKPNDTFFDYQYALYNWGQSIGIPGSPHGKNRADIKALEAWEETKGDTEVVIAVIDTGIDFDHPDLKAKISQDGYDFANDDNDPSDDNGHGTHISGIAAAETDNREGIAGVSWNCKILPLKAIGEDGTGYVSWLVDAIRYAADNGADVINMSLGFSLEPGESVPSLEQAMKYAFDKGLVCVASAGNESAAVLYPAAYEAYCLAVAATDYDDLRPTWSNFGPEVDVAAPGVRIVSCVPTWYWGEGSIPYGFLGGTSTAAPHVAGMAALIKSLKPWLEPEDIMDVIRFSADDVNAGEYPGKDEFIGYGRINMEKALIPIKIKTSK